MNDQKSTQKNTIERQLRIQTVAIIEDGIRKALSALTELLLEMEERTLPELGQSAKINLMLWHRCNERYDELTRLFIELEAQMEEACDGNECHI